MDEPKREGYEATCYCVDSAGDPHQGCPQCGGEGVVGVKEQAPAIVQALAFRKWAHENNLVGPDGQPRTIIGTLPVTKDGVVFCDYEPVFYVASGRVRSGNVAHAIEGGYLGMFRVSDDEESVPLYLCYSTREAAESVAKEQING